jgi:hypothetical protein
VLRWIFGQLSELGGLTGCYTRVQLYVSNIIRFFPQALKERNLLADSNHCNVAGEDTGPWRSKPCKGVICKRWVQPIAENQQLSELKFMGLAGC